MGNCGDTRRPGRQHGDVPLSTAFTDLFSIPHPVALAPMGGSAGGALAAAVSAGGGLGLVGGGRGERDWCERELAVTSHDLVAAIVAEAEAALDRASTRH